MIGSKVERITWSYLAGKVCPTSKRRAEIMAFKFPSLKKKANNPASLIPKDLPSFNWSDLTDKEEIERGSFGSVFIAKYPANGDLVVIKKLLGTEEADKRLFLKEGKILNRLRNKNVVQFKAICPTQYAIMLEYLCFDFAPFGNEDKVNSFEDFLHYMDGHDAFEEFPFHTKIVRDVSSGIVYLHGQGVARRDLKPANVLVSNKHYPGLHNS